MDIFALIGLDLAAIALLAFAVYFPRYRRRDLAIALVGVNVGVLAVSIVLGSSTVSAGLGLGLFGVLSIIRLRSSEIEQNEIAYYLAALALGLITGMSSTVSPLTIGLVVLVVVVLAIVDSPAILRRTREQTIMLDRAYPSEDAAAEAVTALLGVAPKIVTVREVNLASDTTLVDVRYTAPTRSATGGQSAVGTELTTAGRS